MDRVFECLEALDMLVSTNEVTHLIGLAKAKEMDDYPKVPPSAKSL
jgi:hypothetical protein